MKHTPEQLAGMSDGDVDAILAHILCEEWGSYTPKYCIDWSATGPLMVKHGVAPLADGSGLTGATTDSWEHCDPQGYPVHSSRNKNPLRAVVECLILVLQEDNQ